MPCYPLEDQAQYDQEQPWHVIWEPEISSAQLDWDDHMRGEPQEDDWTDNWRKWGEDDWSEDR